MSFASKVKVFLAVVVLLFVLIVVGDAFGTIDAGERGVQVRLGNTIGIKDPGLYFKVPMIDKIITFNTKTQVIVYERENPLAAASKDLQDVQVATVVNYHLDQTQVSKIYSSYGREDIFEENVIRPAVRDIVKATASKYTAEELVTRRSDFTEAVLHQLQERLTENAVVVEQVNITNFQFSDSFNKAIEAKVTAEQDALASKNKLEQVKYEAQQQVEKAKAEAETIRIQAQAINSQGGTDYVNLQAIQKWNGAGCTSYCGLEASSGLLINGR